MNPTRQFVGWPVRGMDARIRALACVLCLLSTVFKVHGSAVDEKSNLQWSLVGYATHEHLGNALYSAALYLPKGVAKDDVYRSGSRKELRIRVDTEQWRLRQWRRHWQGTLQLAESASDSDQQALQQFLDVLEQPLNRMDWLSLYRPLEGQPTLAINGVPIMSFPSDGMMDAIIASLLGDIPPSRQFKLQLLGIEQAPNLSKQDFSIDALTQGQTQDVSGWSAAVTYRAEIQRMALANQEAMKAKANRERAAAAIAGKLASIRQKRIDEERKAAALEAEQMAERQRRLQWEVQRQQQRVAEAQHYYLQWYQWQWRQKVRTEIEYPVWARKLKQQGTIEARFKVNDAGEVLEIDIAQDAPSMLAAEVRRVIQTLSGTMEAPSGLNGETWWLSASHDFKFGNRTQVTLEPPRKPDFLSANSMGFQAKNSG